MAKIEKPQAVERLEEIIKLCDAFMIARGDLGVEMPLEAGAGPAEADDPHRPPLRQAGGRRDPDARIDDHLAGADPRRSVRRLDRRVRRRRRHHALGRKCLGPVPGRSRVDDEQGRDGGRDRRQLPRHHPRPGRPSPRPPPPTRFPPPPGRSPRRSISPPSSPTPRPARPAFGPPASGRASRSSRSRPTSAPSAASASSGASTAFRPRTR